jgi:hypothetical protein
MALTHVELLSDRFFYEAFTSVRSDVSVTPRSKYQPYFCGFVIDAGELKKEVGV